MLDAIWHDNERELPPTTDVQFRNSIWFTRGWTLQDLLAHPTVVFFDRCGKFIGTKRALAAIFQQITSIPSAVLTNDPLRKLASVAAQFSWASSRVEDRAYCLLGLFDINMPLLYGEGKKPFARLLEEVL
jgi:hypothetical protein